MKYVFVEEERKEIEELKKERNYDELDRRLNTRISFGTAGLREIMKSGFAYMNNLTVCQTAQGLAAYLLSQNRAEDTSVIIGYDGRHHSMEFARLSAAIMLQQGIRVYLFSEVVPTPYVSYGVRHFSCSAGIMVTASHNPKEYNGYKIYWSDSAQIAEPIDGHIKKCIEENLEPNLEAVKNISSLVDYSFSALLADPTEEVCRGYNEECSVKLRHFPQRLEQQIPIVYTPMHGVGGKWMGKMFEAFGLDPFVPVAEQMQPDAEFPTVKFPNPEEGKGALQLAIETAERSGSTLILANDPDADRLAVAEKEVDKWKVFNGDETAILLADWVWTNAVAANPTLDAKEHVMLSSTVSSKMLHSIAKKEGFTAVETLTGFKWMGKLAVELSKKGKKVLFAFEESIGYMIGDICWDKDGIRAGAVFAEMATYYKTVKKVTISERLRELYKRYGYFKNANGYFYCYDPAVMKELFDEIRHEGKYVKKCGEFEISHIRDLTGKGYDSRQSDFAPTLPVSNSTQMITFYFENGAEGFFQKDFFFLKLILFVVTLRGSGTEPKLKFYIEHHGSDEKEVSETLVKVRLFMYANPDFIISRRPAVPNEMRVFSLRSSSS